MKKTYIDIENHSPFFTSDYEEPLVREVKALNREIEGVKLAIRDLCPGKEEV